MAALLDLTQTDEEPAPRAGRLAAILGILHLIVDLCTVASACRAAALPGSSLLSPFYLVVGYDVIAFALQLPLGLIVDRLKAPRLALLAGVCGAAAGLACVSLSPVSTMVTAGLGNALFHVGAGAIVLVASEGRAGPSGLYVAPGALGLGAGMRVGRGSTWPVWPLGLLLAAGTLLAWHALLSGQRGARAPCRRNARRGAAWLVGLAALSVSVAIRSFVGFGGPYEAPRDLALMVGLPLVAFAGKLAGGYFADRAGWLESTTGALLLAAPLIAFAGGSPWLLLPGLLVFQTTMPVTLVATHRLLPSRPATAFGLPCLALIAGALPTFFPAGKALYGASTFLALILASGVAVAIGLHLAGVRLAWPRAAAQGTPSR